jgi:hypothetical protein
MPHLVTGQLYDYDSTDEEWLNTIWKEESVKSFYDTLHSKGYTVNLYSPDGPYVYGDIENMYAQISSIASSKDMLALPQYEFTNRYKCIDLNFQIKMYDTMPESKDTSYIINLEDPDKVKYVNNNYFIKNPIDLQRL